MIAPLQVIDVYAAVPATMNAPTVASFTDLSVKLAFVAPASDSTITDYEIKKVLIILHLQPYLLRQALS